MAKPEFQIFFGGLLLIRDWPPRSKVLSGKTAFFLKRKAGKKIFKGAPLGEQLTERRRGAEYLKTSVALRTNFQLSSSAQIGDHQSLFMDQESKTKTDFNIEVLLMNMLQCWNGSMVKTVMDGDGRSKSTLVSRFYTCVINCSRCQAWC